MLDIKFIREHPDKLKEALRNRNVEFDVDYFLALDTRRRAKIKEVDDLRAGQNRTALEISKLQNDERARCIKEAKKLKSRLGSVEFELRVLGEEFDALMYTLPNIPDPEVPNGHDENDNKIIREVGEKPIFTFKPRDYMEIAKRLDLIDTERAAYVSGSRFGYLKNEAVLLEFALVRFAMETLMKQGFIPVVPPVLIRDDVMKHMGYTDTAEDREERYMLEKDGFYLVGTSEQSIAPMHMNETLDLEKLPLRYVGFSTCFRREAGSHGKDTHGILRVHQFDKVEMVIFAHPANSKGEHELMVKMEEALMRRLGLPYRLIALCTGDISRPSAITYDINAWMPGQNEGKGEYRETHSSSNTTDFQSRRLNIKVHEAGGKSEFVHILNGTVFAIGRMLIAIMENYQQEDGSVVIPDVLRPYMGRMEVIKR